MNFSLLARYGMANYLAMSVIVLESGQVDTRLRHQGGQPGKEIQRLKDDMRARTVVVWINIAIFFLLVADIARPFRCAVVLLLQSGCGEIATTPGLSELRSRF
jgi:hypothetical protein